MNSFKEYYCSFFKRVPCFAYDFQVKPCGALRCECVTDTFVHITGYALEDINTRNSWLDCIHPDDAFILTKQLNCLLSGQSNISEFRIVCKSGEIRWLRNYAHPVWAETQDRVIRIYGTAQDITEEKNCEDRVKEFETGYHMRKERLTKFRIQKSEDGRWFHRRGVWIDI